MQCPSCKSQVDATDQFCRSCGCKLMQQTESAPTEETCKPFQHQTNCTCNSQCSEPPHNPMYAPHFPIRSESWLGRLEGQLDDEENRSSSSKESNTFAIVGFILSLFSVFLLAIPFLGGMIWVGSIILCAIGLTRKPRGLAIAGMTISLGWLLIYIFVMTLLLFAL